MALTKEEIFLVYEKRFHSLMLMATMVLADKYQAEDLLQDVAKKLLEIEVQVENELHCRRYLYIMVKNRALNMKRNTARSCTLDLHAVCDVADEGANAALSHETMDWMKESLEGVEAEVKEAFVRHIVQRERIVDLAREMQLKPNSLRAKFEKIKRTLKKAHQTMIDS